MPGKRILIIGAGIAGLSAGCYAQMNGFESRIYEMHTIPGGLCTTWRRGDYAFDGCIDWMTGSAPDGMFYPLWQEVGAVQNTTFLYQEEYCRYIGRGGKEVVFHLDSDKLERELKSHSAEDAGPIEELCRLIRVFKGFKPPVATATEVMGPWDYMKMMPGMMAHGAQYSGFFKYGKVSMAEFAARFKNPGLRDMLSSIWDSRMPVSLFAATMAWCAGRSAGFPQGGSLKVARDMESRYVGLGGSISYRQGVQKIVARDGRAAGIVLSDGSEVAADIVISAADMHSTVHSLLGGAYISDTLSEWVENSPTFPPYIQVSLGVNRDLGGQPRLRYWRMDAPLVIAGRETPYMIVHNYSFDRTLAPKGKTPLVVRFLTDFEYWRKLATDRKSYCAEKDALGKAVIQRLEALYPGLPEQVEVIDVATPATYVRYTGTWRGATMGFLPTTSNFAKSLPKTLPGLDDFYLAGQWLVPGGGLPNALKTGRDVLQIICRRGGKKFHTSLPA
jgi:phytoene dehydrogenase-like protein